MNRQFFFRCFAVMLVALAVIPASLAGKRSAKASRSKVPDFNGVITYIGKVSRIPDRKITSVKLREFDSFYDMYFSDDFTKRVENINNQIVVSYVTGIRNDYFFQTIESKIDGSVVYITATPDEQRLYQLTPRMMRANSKRVNGASGKKNILGHKCSKVVCNMVTEGNIHLQLIAWYDPKIKIDGYYVPFFGEIKGLPLMYDFYNGEYVVTFTATKINKRPVLSNTFDPPADVTPVSMTDYVMSQQ